MKKSLSKYLIVLLLILTAFFLIQIGNLNLNYTAQASITVIEYDLSNGKVSIIEDDPNSGTSKLLKADGTLVKENVPANAIYKFSGNGKIDDYTLQDNIYGYITVDTTCNILLSSASISLAKGVDLNGIYIAKGNVDLIIADDTKNLILLDDSDGVVNSENKGNAGIYVGVGSNLTIKGEKNGTGELIVRGGSINGSNSGGGAGIGGNGAINENRDTKCGNIKIINTKIDVTGGNANASIGGGGAGIGSGGEAEDNVSISEHSIIIENSVVTANGGSAKSGDAGAGLGNGGSGWSSLEDIMLLNGNKAIGKVEAIKKVNITIIGSTVNSNGGTTSVIIQGCESSKNYGVIADLLSIQRSNLIATSGGIYSTKDDKWGKSYGVYANSIKIEGLSNIDANAGRAMSSYAFFIEDIKSLEDYRLSNEECGLSEDNNDLNKTFRKKVADVPNGDIITKLIISKTNLKQELLQLSDEPNEELKYGNIYHLGISGGSGEGAVTFESNNTDVAIVDNEGNFTIVGIGAVNITITKKEDKNYLEEHYEYSAETIQRDVNITNLVAVDRPFEMDNFKVTLNGGKLEGVLEKDDIFIDFPKEGRLEDNNLGEQIVYYDVILQGADKDKYIFKHSEIYVNITKAIAEIIENENGFMIDSKYTKGEIYTNIQDAKQALLEVQSKFITEGYIKNYVDTTFCDLPNNVSSVNYEDKYMKKLDEIKNIADGYVFNGNTYSDIDTVLEIIELIVKTEIFKEKINELKKMLSGLDRTCAGDSIIKNEINLGTVEIDDLGFSNSESLAMVYNTAFEKVLFAQKLQRSINLLNKTMEEKIKEKLYTQRSLDSLYAIFLKIAEVLKVSTNIMQIEEIMQEWQFAISQLKLLTLQTEHDNADNIFNANGLPYDSIFKTKEVNSADLENEILDLIKRNEVIIIGDRDNIIIKNLKKSVIKYIFESGVFSQTITKSDRDDIVGESTVTVKLPSTNTGKKYSVLLKTSDGKLVYKSCTVVDGILTFNTDEFGTFVVLAVEPVKLIYSIIPATFIILLVVLYFALPKLMKKREGV